MPKPAELRGGPARQRSVAGVAGALCVAVLAAGCFLAAAAPQPAAAADGTTTSSGSIAPVYEVKTGEVHGLGKVLVDGQGLTLYVFAPDKHSGSSKCYGRCASAWPPLVLPSGVRRAPAGPGVRSALLGTTKRTDGTLQVTYGGHPLYYYSADPVGKIMCQHVTMHGGLWLIVKPNGQPNMAKGKMMHM